MEKPSGYYEFDTASDETTLIGIVADKLDDLVTDISLSRAGEVIGNAWDDALLNIADKALNLIDLVENLKGRNQKSKEQLDNVKVSPGITEQANEIINQNKQQQR